MFINKLKRLHMEMNVDRQPTDFKYSWRTKFLVAHGLQAVDLLELT